MPSSNANKAPSELSPEELEDEVTKTQGSLQVYGKDKSKEGKKKLAAARKRLKALLAHLPINHPLNVANAGKKTTKPKLPPVPNHPATSAASHKFHDI